MSEASKFLLLHPGGRALQQASWHICLHCNARACCDRLAPTLKKHVLGALTGQRDEAWGGADLMEFFHLMRLYSFSQSQLQPVNYLKGVPGDTTLWRCACPQIFIAIVLPPCSSALLALCTPTPRGLLSSSCPFCTVFIPKLCSQAIDTLDKKAYQCRGPNTDIEPLAEVFPLAQQPAWQPLPAEQLNAALSLQPGVFALSEVGICVWRCMCAWLKPLWSCCTTRARCLRRRKIAVAFSNPLWLLWCWLDASQRLLAGTPAYNHRAACMQAEKGVPVAPGAYQAEDASGGAAVKREKKSGKKRKLDAPD